ncbi:MAG: hypothetical protein R6U94_05735 [Nitriliruptoraceae bacterium]
MVVLSDRIYVALVHRERQGNQREGILVNAVNTVRPTTRRLALIASITTALSMAALPSADAALESPPDLSEEECDTTPMVDDSQHLTVLEGDATAAATDAVAEALETGQISLQVSRDHLAADSAEVHEIVTDGTPFTSVTYRIGGDFSALSNLTVVLDEDQNIVQYNEALFSESKGGTFQIHSYADGELVLEEETDVTYVTNFMLQRTMDDGSAVTLQSAGGTAACIALALGVPGSIGALIAKTCAVSCAAAATPPGATVCAACIGAAALLGTGAAAAAVSCFR